MIFRVLALTVFFAFSACGGGESGGPAGSGGVAEDSSPQVAVPFGAVVSDVECREQRDYLDAAGAQQYSTYMYRDTEYSWMDGDVQVSYAVSQAGDEHMLFRSRREKVDAGRTRVSGTGTNWVRDEAGRWEKNQVSFERELIKVGDTVHVQNNKVNGVETPFYWTITSYARDEKTDVTVFRHTKPGVRDTAERRYQRIEQSCTYVRR